MTPAVLVRQMGYRGLQRGDEEMTMSLWVASKVSGVDVQRISRDEFAEHETEEHVAKCSE